MKSTIPFTQKRVVSFSKNKNKFIEVVSLFHLKNQVKRIHDKQHYTTLNKQINL